MTEGKPFSGHYLDGRSARRHKIQVTVGATGLRVLMADGHSVWWPYTEIKQTQGFHPGEPVRLERGGDLGEVLVVHEPGFLDAVRIAAPEARLKGPPRRGAMVAIAVSALVGAAVLGVVGYFWGVPAIAEVGTASVPVSWEEALGDQVVAEMVPKDQVCADPVSQMAIERVVARLLDGHKSPYHYTVTIARSDEINAFAAPGGRVVVFSGLLEKTRRPEELAGVLAHEIEHVEKRHGTRAILRRLSMSLLLAALVGDASSIKQILDAAGTLGAMSYARQDEAEADREGMKLLQAAELDPQGMIDVFEMLRREGGDMPEQLAFLSDHPQTGDRIAVLKAMAKAVTYQPRPLDVGVPWSRASHPK